MADARVPPARKSLLETLSRMEPNVEKVLDTRAVASIAISMKRIADNTDRLYFQMERVCEMLANIEINVRGR